MLPLKENISPIKDNIWTWDRIEKSPPNKICKAIHKNYVSFFGHLVKDSEYSKLPISYSAYSKLLSCFVLDWMLPNATSEIRLIAERAGLVKVCEDNAEELFAQFLQHALKGETTAALEIFRRIPIFFGYEEKCAQIFNQIINQEMSPLLEAVIRQVPTRRHQLLYDKCLFYSISTNPADGQKSKIWLKLGANIHLRFALPSQWTVQYNCHPVGTFFHLAVDHNNSALASLLVESKFDITLLKGFKPQFYFAEKGADEFVLSWVRQYGGINDQNEKGQALIQFIKSPDIFKKMLELGADLNLKDNEGCFIWRNMRVEDAECDRLCGDKIRDNISYHSFMLFRHFCPISNPDYFEHLLSTIVELDSRDPCGRSILDRQTEWPCIELLLKKGASLTNQDNHGRNCLFFKKTPESIRNLVQRGLDINHLNKLGVTALDDLLERIGDEEWKWESAIEMVRCGALGIYSPEVIRALIRQIRPSTKLNPLHQQLFLAMEEHGFDWRTELFTTGNVPLTAVEYLIKKLKNPVLVLNLFAKQDVESYKKFFLKWISGSSSIEQKLQPFLQDEETKKEIYSYLLSLAEEYDTNAIVDVLVRNDLSENPFLEKLLYASPARYPKILDYLKNPNTLNFNNLSISEITHISENATFHYLLHQKPTIENLKILTDYWQRDVFCLSERQMGQLICYATYPCFHNTAELSEFIKILQSKFFSWRNIAFEEYKTTFLNYVVFQLESPQILLPLSKHCTDTVALLTKEFNYWNELDPDSHNERLYEVGVKLLEPLKTRKEITQLFFEMAYRFGSNPQLIINILLNFYNSSKNQEFDLKVLYDAFNSSFFSEDSLNAFLGYCIDHHASYWSPFIIQVLTRYKGELELSKELKVKILKRYYSKSSVVIEVFKHVKPCEKNQFLDVLFSKIKLFPLIRIVGTAYNVETLPVSKKRSLVYNIINNFPTTSKGKQLLKEPLDLIYLDSILSKIWSAFPPLSQALNKNGLHKMIENIRSICLNIKEHFNVTEYVENPDKPSILEIGYMVPWRDYELIGEIGRQLTDYEYVVSLDKLSEGLNETNLKVFDSFIYNEPEHYQLGSRLPLLTQEHSSTDEKISEQAKIELDKLLKELAIGEPEKLNDINKQVNLIINKIRFKPMPDELEETLRKNTHVPSLLANSIEMLNLLRNKEDIAFCLVYFAKELPKMTTESLHCWSLTYAEALLREVFNRAVSDKEPNYLKAEDLIDDYGNIMPAENYREGISKLINFVAKWTAYTGTPAPDTPELIAFHCKLRDGLVQLAIMLTKTKDIPNRNLCIADLGFAGNKCGARWKGTVYQTLMLMKNGTLPTFVDLVYNEFSQLRFRIIHGMIGNSANNVHKFNQLMSLVGEDLGLPGSEFLKDNVDRSVTYTFTKPSVLLEFMEKYTFGKKVELLQQVLKELFADITARDMIFHWIRQNIPDDMLASYYDPVIEEVKKAVAAKQTREQIQAKMKNIPWPVEEPNPLQAIAKARFEDFRENVVLDPMTGNFKLSFLIYMMLQMKIIKK